MERAAIELKAISVRDLVLPLAFIGMPPIYAVVSPGDGSDRGGRRQSQSTHFDRTGGRNPEWDQELRFDLPADGASLSLILLEFEFVSRRGVGGVLSDRVVGKAWVLLRDLVEEYNVAFGSRGGGFKSVAFQESSPDRESAGMVSFLYRIGSQREGIESPAPEPASPVTPASSSTNYYPPPPFPPAEQLWAVQQPGAMHYYCCPAPPPPPPSDSDGYPAAGYDFAWSGYVEPWATAPVPPPAAEPYGYARKECEWTGSLWGGDGRGYPAPMYGWTAKYH